MPILSPTRRTAHLLADPDCNCVAGFEGDYGPCSCASNRFRRTQRRWRFETRNGMSYDPPAEWGAPPEHDEARDRMRATWPVAGRGRV